MRIPSALGPLDEVEADFCVPERAPISDDFAPSAAVAVHSREPDDLVLEREFQRRFADVDEIGPDTEAELRLEVWEDRGSVYDEERDRRAQFHLRTHRHIAARRMVPCRRPVARRASRRPRARAHRFRRVASRRGPPSSDPDEPPGSSGRSALGVGRLRAARDGRRS
jgi:hypothetical protein